MLMALESGCINLDLYKEMSPYDTSTNTDSLSSEETSNQKLDNQESDTYTDSISSTDTKFLDTVSSDAETMDTDAPNLILINCVQGEILKNKVCILSSWKFKGL